MRKKLLSMMMVCLSAHGLNAAVPEFRDEDWATIPSSGLIKKEEVMKLFAVPIEKNGRRWTLDLFDEDDLKAVIADEQFGVKQQNDEGRFARQPVSLDRAGLLEYELYLVGLTKTRHDSKGEEGERFCLEVRLPIFMQLTPEELANPIVRAIRLPMTFEEESKLAQENMAKYQRTIWLKQAYHLLIFVKSERKANAAAEIDAKRAEFEREVK